MRRALALGLLAWASSLASLGACHPDDKSGRAADAKCATEAQARAYRECRAASSQDQCKAKNGNWVEVPLFSSGSEFICSCELPDKGCACRTASDCVGKCIAPGDACQSSEGATCQEWSRGGCRCLVDGDGKVGRHCAD